MILNAQIASVVMVSKQVSARTLRLALRIGLLSSLHFTGAKTLRQ